MSAFTRDFGSQTAKGGFRNEEDVIAKFNNRAQDADARQRLTIMRYRLEEIEYVRAEKIPGRHKADIQVQVRIVIKLKTLIESENIQVKLVSNGRGYNQIDKRRVKDYIEMRQMPQAISSILRRFSGEEQPTVSDPKDSRRMFLNEFSLDEQAKIVHFFEENKLLVLSDIIKGRWPYSAEWYLVIRNLPASQTYDRALHDINYVMNFYGKGNVEITSKGSLKIGKITLQRKGGDGGRNTANMLQFKLDPTAIMECK